MFEAKVLPDKVSHSASISALNKGGQWRLALDLFREIRQNSRPDKFIYSAAVAQWHLFFLLLELRVSVESNTNKQAAERFFFFPLS